MATKQQIQAQRDAAFKAKQKAIGQGSDEQGNAIHYSGLTQLPNDPRTGQPILEAGQRDDGTSRMHTMAANEKPFTTYRPPQAVPPQGQVTPVTTSAVVPNQQPQQAPTATAAPFALPSTPISAGNKLGYDPGGLNDPNMRPVRSRMQPGGVGTVTGIEYTTQAKPDEAQTFDAKRGGNVLTKDGKEIGFTRIDAERRVATTNVPTATIAANTDAASRSVASQMPGGSAKTNPDSLVQYKEGAQPWQGGQKVLSDLNMAAANQGKLPVAPLKISEIPGMLQNANDAVLGTITGTAPAIKIPTDRQPLDPAYMAAQKPWTPPTTNPTQTAGVPPPTPPPVPGDLAATILQTRESRAADYEAAKKKKDDEDAQNAQGNTAYSLPPTR